MNLCDPRTIRDVMSMYGMTFRKELGQNFLTNAAVVEDIADACSDTRDATILEIGPGIGVLTQISAGVCDDAKQSAVARLVELCGGVLALYAALPLLEAVLELIETVGGG